MTFYLCCSLTETSIYSKVRLNVKSGCRMQLPDGAAYYM